MEAGPGFDRGVPRAKTSSYRSLVCKDIAIHCIFGVRAACCPSNFGEDLKLACDAQPID